MSAPSVEAVIEKKLREVERQMDALRDERDRLQQALTVLSGNGAAPTAAPRRPRANATTRRRGRGAKKSGRRASRGSNIAAILAHVGENPGQTAGDIAGGTQIAQSVVYSAVGRLASSGRLRREALADGRVAYYPVES